MLPYLQRARAVTSCRVTQWRQHWRHSLRHNVGYCSDDDNDDADDDSAAADDVDIADRTSATRSRTRKLLATNSSSMELSVKLLPEPPLPLINAQAVDFRYTTKLRVIILYNADLYTEQNKSPISSRYRQWNGTLWYQHGSVSWQLGAESEVTVMKCRLLTSLVPRLPSVHQDDDSAAWRLNYARIVNCPHQRRRDDRLSDWRTPAVNYSPATFLIRRSQRTSRFTGFSEKATKTVVIPCWSCLDKRTTSARALDEPARWMLDSMTDSMQRVLVVRSTSGLMS